MSKNYKTLKQLESTPKSTLTNSFFLQQQQYQLQYAQLTDYFANKNIFENQRMRELYQRPLEEQQLSVGAINRRLLNQNSQSPQPLVQSPTISLASSSSSFNIKNSNTMLINSQQQGSSSSNLSASAFTPSTMFQGSRNIDRTKLFIGNLPASTRLQELLDLFKKFGRINEKLSVVKDQNYAFIHFYNEEDAKKALIEVNDSLFKDRYIRVQYSTSQGHVKRSKSL